MPRPMRNEQFSADEVCIVHAIQRCVQRAFLAGVDDKTGKDFSFRREWIRRRMEALASVFGIDVLTYAIMSNHLHVILRNRPDVVFPGSRRVGISILGERVSAVADVAVWRLFELGVSIV